MCKDCKSCQLGQDPKDRAHCQNPLAPRFQKPFRPDGRQWACSKFDQKNALK